MAADLTGEEALVCLEAIGCVYSEGWAPRVGPHRAELDDNKREQLVRKLAALAGLDPEETLRTVGLVGHPGGL